MTAIRRPTRDTRPIDIDAGYKRVMKRFPLIMAALALAGCQTTRYITVACLTPVQFEQLKAQLPPKVADKLTGRADEDLRIIAGSSVRLRGYAEGLLAILEGCRAK